MPVEGIELVIHFEHESAVGAFWLIAEDGDRIEAIEIGKVNGLIGDEQSLTDIRIELVGEEAHGIVFNIRHKKHLRKH